MRVLIATDMEGAAGIDRMEQCHPMYPEAFAMGCRHLMADINACIRGLRRGGATEIKEWTREWLEGPSPFEAHPAASRPSPP
ncbi:MAG: M55 family metallopeptidase [Armatimonadetes bacterium]|nr:M55 family metallopeptidase [Armatimonadota bacterium]